MDEILCAADDPDHPGGFCDRPEGHAGDHSSSGFCRWPRLTDAEQREAILRDVVAAVLADYPKTADLHTGSQFEIATIIDRRLHSAESIELADGTVFIRRAAVPIQPEKSS